MRLDWTHGAEVEMDLVYERLEAFAAGAGDRFVRRIYARVDGLILNPWKGRMVPEYNVERFRELIEPPYRIMYQVFGDRIEIATIRHNAQVLPQPDR